MKSNLKAQYNSVTTECTAISGAPAAKITPMQQMRRLTMACLLGEDLYYQSGGSVKEDIVKILPLLTMNEAVELAVEAREKQKLRHVPLFLAVEMLKHPHLRKGVSKVLQQVIKRPDELAEVLSLYWKGGKKPIPAQLKKGLAAAFNKFDEYQFAKYNRNNAIKLRDVMFLVHPKPENEQKAELFKKLAENTLATPDTWEVRLSAAGCLPSKRREAWEELLRNKKLPSMALVKNLRNMTQDSVDPKLVRQALTDLNPKVLVPLQVVQAMLTAPEYLPQLETLFSKFFEGKEKLSGRTLFVIDVSGSMGAQTSSKATATRWQVAASLAMIAREQCQDLVIYCTAGDFRKHNTAMIPAVRGYAILGEVQKMYRNLGGNGIFTTQCLNWLKSQEKEVDRIIVFSDSQDVDRSAAKPSPFGKTNYIVDVSNHKNGINYQGVWTAEISGWSENFFDYILASEGLETNVAEGA